MNQQLNEPKECFCGRLNPTRENWPNEMTEKEEKIMKDHFVYLQKLLKEKKLIMAGPVFSNPVYGLIILQVDSKKEAKEIQNTLKILESPSQTHNRFQEYPETDEDFSPPKLSKILR